MPRNIMVGFCFFFFFNRLKYEREPLQPVVLSAILQKNHWVAAIFFNNLKKNLDAVFGASVRVGGRERGKVGSHVKNIPVRRHSAFYS